MRDIVATIQGEQDESIRLDHPEVLVIEGGPGTGKTVVALPRVTLLGVLSLVWSFRKDTTERNAGMVAFRCWRRPTTRLPLARDSAACSA
jgi:hypothetical protein